MFAKKLLALAAFVLPALAYAAPQSVLGVSYTLPAGWKAEPQPVRQKTLMTGATIQTQQVKFSASLPPLTSRMQISRAAVAQSAVDTAVDACKTNMNQSMLQQFRQQAGFSSLGDKTAQFSALKGCLSEFTFRSAQGFTMYGRVFSGFIKGRVIVFFLGATDQNTPQGLKSHTIRFKEMDALLNSLSIR